MEDTLDTIVDYLTNNFGPLLTTIKTERSDTETEEPKDIKRGVSRKNKFPKIEVLPSGTEHDYAFETQPLLEPWLVHGVVLRITHMAAKTELVEDTLLRYSETVNRLQEADDTFGGEFNWVQLGEEDYSEMLTSQEERQMMQMLLIPLTCRTL